MFEWLDMIWLVAGSGILFGWITFGDKEILPSLIEPTSWRYGAEKSPISNFAVSKSPNRMWDVVTEDGKHIVFFESDDYKITWDISENNDVPRITQRSRLVPPRKLETEVTMSQKSHVQFWDLRIPEKEMYGYLLSQKLETV